MNHNPFDKACRYLVMLDPTGFITWLLGLPLEKFGFRGWLDTRAISLPSDSDRTSDLVAHIVPIGKDEAPWALPIEFQIEPDPEMFGRILAFLIAIWKYVRPDVRRGSRFNLGGAIINLTGRGNCSREMSWPDAGLATQLKVIEMNLEHAKAVDLLGGIESGRWPRSLLTIVPLMTEGDVPAILD